MKLSSKRLQALAATFESTPDTGRFRRPPGSRTIDVYSDETIRDALETAKPITTIQWDFGTIGFNGGFSIYGLSLRSGERLYVLRGEDHGTLLIGAVQQTNVRQDDREFLEIFERTQGQAFEVEIPTADDTADDEDGYRILLVDNWGEAARQPCKSL